MTLEDIMKNMLNNVKKSSSQDNQPLQNEQEKILFNLENLSKVPQGRCKILWTVSWFFFAREFLHIIF